MRIYLIGFMGAGKTTVGKILARKLAATFIDLDHKIEQKQNKTIPEIFATKGEDFFRELEKNTLHEITAEFPNAIISLGGGTPCFFDNMDFVNQNGLAIYLKLKPEALKHRLLNARSNRPLLKDKTPEQLLEFINETLEKREPYYNRAKLIVDNSSRNIEPLLTALSYHTPKI